MLDNGGGSSAGAILSCITTWSYRDWRIFPVWFGSGGWHSTGANGDRGARQTASAKWGRWSPLR